VESYGRAVARGLWRRTAPRLSSGLRPGAGDVNTGLGAVLILSALAVLGCVPCWQCLPGHVMICPDNPRAGFRIRLTR
jgi:hypothetical protein